MSSGCGCGCKSAVGSCEKEFQYAVKVVCGVVSPVVPGTATPPNPVAPGHYYTAINIHNPAKCGCITFRFKAAQALPWQNLDSPIGTVTPFRSIRLCADQAVEIDNAQILAMFPRVSFIKGYVVIESPEELDVVAVYTVAQDFCGPCHGFYTERVPARCVPVCEDLILPISTGVADWQTVSAPSVSSPGPVVKLTGSKPPGWSPAPSGSAWVSAAALDSTNASLGDYTYDLSFELCSGFSNPALQMDVLTDNSSKIYLNSHQIGTTPTAGYITVTTITAPPGLFVPGPNILRVVVTNEPDVTKGTPNPTGFAVAGLLRVQGGRCPCAELPLLPAAQFRPVNPVDNPTTDQSSSSVGGSTAKS